MHWIWGQASSGELQATSSLTIVTGYYRMCLSRLVVSGFKTQTTTPPNPGRNSCIVQLHVPGPGTTMKGYNMTKKNKLKTKNFYLKTQKLVNDEFKKEAKRIREEDEKKN